MHLLDKAAGVAVRHGPKRLRVFSGGWGDRSVRERFLRETADPHPGDPIRVRWGSPIEQGPLVVRHGTYRGSAELHTEAQIGHAMQVAPDGPWNRICVLMAAWNDHGYDTRIKIAEDLARQGIAAVIPENPYYGTRRPSDLDQPIHTVADFGLMGIEALTEATGIVAWLQDEGHEVGISGYSMGGNMAAYGSALMKRPVATAALAASYSPGPVFLEGVLRGGIAWDSLGGPGAEASLHEFLHAASVLRVPPPDHARHAVIVGATADGFIPESAVRRLHEHWPGSQLRWEAGGHATLLWLRRDRLVSAIVSSFGRAFASAPYS